jgi:hypothetical protein
MNLLNITRIATCQAVTEYPKAAGTKKISNFALQVII